MGLETVVNIADLVRTNPPGTDPKSQGDDHLRNIKTALLNNIVGYTGAVTVTGVDGGAVNAYTLTPAAGTLIAYGLRMVAIFSPTITNTGAVTLNISGLGVKNVLSVAGIALVANDLIAGRVYVAVYNGTEFRLVSVTQNFIEQLAFSSAFPAQPGNGGKFPTTDGGTPGVVSWTDTFTIPISFTSRLNEAKGTDIASASTINLSTATGNLIHITGNTGPITAITIPVGAERTLIFDSTPTLAHSASLLLPGAANITAAAGDRCIVRGDTTGANVIDYIPANGRAVSAVTYGLSAPLATLVPTAAANVDALTVFTAAYDNYVIEIEGVRNNAGAGTDQLCYRLANAGVVDTGSNYVSMALVGTSGATAAQQIASGNILGTGRGVSGEIRLQNMNAASTAKSGQLFTTGEAGGAIYTAVGTATLYISASAASGIRFFWSTGANFLAGGVIRIYGYNNT